MPPAETAHGMTVADLARRYRVSPEKVRGWIRRRELAAINTAASRAAKPRYVVTGSALEAFEQRRAAVVEPPPKPRRTRPKVTVDYYPD